MWWPFRHDPNVLMLHYSDLKQDLPGQLRRIAKFLDVDVPAAAWPEIERKCSFAWMKENELKFQYHIPGSKEQFGEGKDVMSPEQIAAFEKLEEETFKDPDQLRWAR